MMDLLVPHLPLIAYVLVLLFITLYATLSSIEFGVAAFMALPEPPVSRAEIDRYFGPMWESTNVFLIFSMVGLVMFFPAVVMRLADLYTLVSTALLFFVVRIIGIFGVFYARSEARAFRMLFAAGSLLAPLTLSGVFYFALTGMPPAFPPSTLLWSLWFSVFGAIIMLSSAFVARYAGSAFYGFLSRAGILGTGLFLIGAAGILSFDPGGNRSGALAAGLFIALLVLAGAALRIREMRRPLLSYFCHALMVAILLYGTAFAHLPYLLYPYLTLEAAFTAPQMFIIMLQMVPFGLLIAVPSLAFAWHLFARSTIRPADL